MKLRKTSPKFHEATEAEKNEEFELVVEVFAPQHNKRVPRDVACLGKRTPLTTADKKVIEKHSIGLPVADTLKLSTLNCHPFILEGTIPLEDFQKRLIGLPITIRYNPGFQVISEAQREDLHLTPALAQRISLGGTTLVSAANQEASTAHQDLLPSPSEDLRNRVTSDHLTSLVIHNSHLSNKQHELVVRVCAWLDNVSTPIATELDLDSQLQYSQFISTLNFDEDIWDLIERDARQRKSPLRQKRNTMSIGTNDNSVRVSNSTRPSGTYQRPSEGHTRTTMHTIKDHPSSSVRRPKSMPSGSQMPTCWNDEMDKFICHLEAQGEFSTISVVLMLKKKFPELIDVSTPLLST